MINLFILFSCSVCFADTSQNILEEARTDTGIALLNEEIRKLGEDGDLRSNQLSTIANAGFGIVLSGDAEVGTDVIPSRYYLPCSGTFSKIIAYAKTAPTGDDIIIDVNLNGTSILNAGNITIPATSNSVTVTSFATTAFYTDDYLTIDIDQIGSSVAGADIVLSFYVAKAKS